MYRITADLPAFTTASRTGLELLVGQQVIVNFEMAPLTVQETVTVTAEAPLIDTSTSSMGGNIDPRQVSELPVNGRNWTSLVLLAPGNLFNHENYGSYVTQESNSSYGRPTTNPNVAYQPRMLQLGFRLTF